MCSFHRERDVRPVIAAVLDGLAAGAQLPDSRKEAGTHGRREKKSLAALRAML
jgi:hypothetical protein